MCGKFVCHTPPVQWCLLCCMVADLACGIWVLGLCPLPPPRADWGGWVDLPYGMNFASVNNVITDSIIQLMHSMLCVFIEVLEVKARRKKRSEGNFIMSMQSALKRHYDTRSVALGGVFVLTNGKARVHVMVWILFTLIAVILPIWCAVPCCIADSITGSLYIPSSFVAMGNTSLESRVSGTASAKADDEHWCVGSTVFCGSRFLSRAAEFAFFHGILIYLQNSAEFRKKIEKWSTIDDAILSWNVAEKFKPNCLKPCALK